MVRNSSRFDDDIDYYTNLATVSNARAGDHLQIPRCESPEPAEFDTQSILSKGSGRSAKTINTVKSGASKSTVKMNGAGKLTKSPAPGKTISSVQYNAKPNTPKPNTPKPKAPLAMPKEFDEKEFTCSSETVGPLSFLE